MLDILHRFLNGVTVRDSSEQSGAASTHSNSPRLILARPSSPQSRLAVAVAVATVLKRAPVARVAACGRGALKRARQRAQQRGATRGRRDGSVVGVVGRWDAACRFGQESQGRRGGAGELQSRCIQGK